MEPFRFANSSEEERVLLLELAPGMLPRQAVVHTATATATVQLGGGVTISVPPGEAVAVFMGLSARTHQFVILDGAGTAVDRKTHRFVPPLGDDHGHEITLEDFTLD
ncbi:MAG: hypothetical protein P4L36_17235 [Holophaga sp.]|nr:hypothetical protein [Holophaga sp.]